MKRGRKGRPVMCVETGKVFDSVTEAALWLNVAPSTVFHALTGYAKSAGGYRWEYIDIEGPVVPKPRSRPSMTIRDVQLEAERRSKETGKLVRYADIQREETLQLMHRQAAHAMLKKRREQGDGV